MTITTIHFIVFQKTRTFLKMESNIVSLTIDKIGKIFSKDCLGLRAAHSKHIKSFEEFLYILMQLISVQRSNTEYISF